MSKPDTPETGNQSGNCPEWTQLLDRSWVYGNGYVFASVWPSGRWVAYVEGVGDMVDAEGPFRGQECSPYQAKAEATSALRRYARAMQAWLDALLPEEPSDE